MVDPGKHLTVQYLDIVDVKHIARKVQHRQQAFHESLERALGVVLLNYGDSQVKVRCVNGEWLGTKAEVVPRRGKGGGIPLCEHGHPLLETSEAPRLALIGEET